MIPLHPLTLSSQGCSGDTETPCPVLQGCGPGPWDPCPHFLEGDILNLTEDAVMVRDPLPPPHTDSIAQLAHSPSLHQHYLSSPETPWLPSQLLEPSVIQKKAGWGPLRAGGGSPPNGVWEELLTEKALWPEACRWPGKYRRFPGLVVHTCVCMSSHAPLT